jgi:hypothetical protein
MVQWMVAPDVPCARRRMPSRASCSTRRGGRPRIGTRTEVVVRREVDERRASAGSSRASRAPRGFRRSVRRSPVAVERRVLVAQLGVESGARRATPLTPMPRSARPSGVGRLSCRATTSPTKV